MINFCRLVQAVQIVNNVESTLLTKIVKRLCQEGCVPQAFSTEESRKLSEALSLGEEKLFFLLATLSYIIQEVKFSINQYAYGNM